MKIAFKASAFVCGIWLTIMAAMGKIHANRFDYAFLLGFLTLTIFVRLLESIKENLKKRLDL